MTSSSIWLVQDTASLVLEGGDDALCVVHKRYPKPRATCDVVDFDDFERDPRGAMEGKRLLYFVGLNLAKTPQTRGREVWDVLFYGMPEVQKVSIDTSLFVGEPWRAWFHFGLVGARYAEYTYSYLAERHWHQHQEGTRESDPFSLEEILRWGRGIVEADHDRYFGEVDVEIVDVGPEAHACYQAEKAAAFEEERTEAAILLRLRRVAKEACPRWSIPGDVVLFRQRDWKIVRTDLPVDTYLTNRLFERVALADAVLREFKGTAT